MDRRRTDADIARGKIQSELAGEDLALRRRGQALQEARSKARLELDNLVAKANIETQSSL